jgi:undecaprenol kinase
MPAEPRARHKNQPLRARFGCALHGLHQALRAEASLRLQAVSALIVLAALLVLRPAPVWWALTLLAAALVLCAELLNTAIEQLADALHPTDSAQIRLVKDCAAAGVLLAVLGALAVGAALLVHLLAERHLIIF